MSVDTLRIYNALANEGRLFLDNVFPTGYKVRDMPLSFKANKHIIIGWGRCKIINFSFLIEITLTNVYGVRRNEALLAFPAWVCNFADFLQKVKQKSYVKKSKSENLYKKK
uniref:Uncharacterized protein n=1 Tax=Glossina austeni TaxID=7395 RepID=A0A1A9VWI8_GLOAU